MANLDILTAAWPRWSRLEPEAAWFVPGRIELLGKHTDYGGGRSLLCAVERGFRVLSAPRRDRRVRLLDARSGERAEFVPEEPPPTNWARYCAAVVRRLTADGRFAHGADIAFFSDLPPAAGMSSSSAFVVASYLALTGDAAGKGREDLAAYLAAAEVGVGTHGGSEDHTAILCCQPGHWSQYRFRPTQPEATVRAPGDLSLVIAVSGVTASKAGAERGAFNRVSAVAAEILGCCNHLTGRADTSLRAALGSSPEAREHLRAELPPPLQARLDQFWNESEVWIPEAVAAARAGNWDEFGRCVAASQTAAEAALGNQIPETVALVAIARRHGAIAASSFGAGFGGSVWALIPRTQAADFGRAWMRGYHAAFAAHAASSLCFESAAGPPATRLYGQF